MLKGSEMVVHLLKREVTLQIIDALETKRNLELSLGYSQRAENTWAILNTLREQLAWEPKPGEAVINLDEDKNKAIVVRSQPDNAYNTDIFYQELDSTTPAYIHALMDARDLGSIDWRG